MKLCLAVVLFVFLAAGCGSKPKKPNVPAADFFPVKPYLMGQLARLDTAQYTFTKIETEGADADTVLIRAKEVRGFAADFINLPDITDTSIKNDYRIDRLWDDMLNAFVFTSTTKENHPVTREDVVLEPDVRNPAQNNIKSVFVQMAVTSGDTIIQKNLTWEADKRFTITTTRQLPQQPGDTRTLTVMWNGFIK